MAENNPLNPNKNTSSQERQENAPFPKSDTVPENESEKDSKEEKGFMATLKKVGYSVWIIVMVIGGALAFIVSLFVL